MSNSIEKFLSLLTDNGIKPKRKRRSDNKRGKAVSKRKRRNSKGEFTVEYLNNSVFQYEYHESMPSTPSHTGNLDSELSHYLHQIKLDYDSNDIPKEDLINGDLESLVDNVQRGLESLLLKKSKASTSDYNRESQINIKLGYCKELLQFITKEKVHDKEKSTNSIISYNWQGRINEELPMLFKKLTGKWISKSTTYNQFKKIFTGQPIPKIEPIKWHDDNASELLYFIMQLISSGNINGNINRMDYAKLKGCFRTIDNMEFQQNFKELKQQINRNLSEQKRKEIDALVKEF